MGHYGCADDADSVEAIVLLLIATIGVCYFIEIFILPQTQPSFLEMGRALVSPHLRQSGIAYIAHPKSLQSQEQ
jgi:hypothetical protein